MDTSTWTTLSTVLLALSNAVYLFWTLLLRGVGKIANVAEEEGLTTWLTSRSSKILTVTNILFLVVNILASIFKFDLAFMGTLGFLVLAVLSIPLAFCFYAAMWGICVFLFKLFSLNSILSIIHLDFKYWLKMLYTFLLVYVQLMGAFIVIFQALVMYSGKIYPILSA